jgi:ATP-dependent Clp protease adaptor protein ClpS
MSESSAVLTPPAKKQKPDETKPKPQKPWAVVVLNDNDHTFRYVMELLQKVIRCEAEKCFQLTKQIHDTGRAIVWSGSKEVAELKRDQIKSGGKDFYSENAPVSYPLGCIIEEMP